jgi:hypothetical protein
MSLEYRILSEPSVYALQEEVNKWIEFGWKPQGSMVIKPKEKGYSGIFISFEGEPAKYCQPMVKES